MKLAASNNSVGKPPRCTLSLVPLVPRIAQSVPRDWNIPSRGGQGRATLRFSLLRRGNLSYSRYIEHFLVLFKDTSRSLHPLHQQVCPLSERHRVFTPNKRGLCSPSPWVGPPAGWGDGHTLQTLVLLGLLFCFVIETFFQRHCGSRILLSDSEPMD